MLFVGAMAIIDTFLRLMVHQKAAALRIVPDEAPTLVKDDVTVRLSMPAVSSEIVSSIVSEIIGPRETAGPQMGTYLEGRYQTPGGDSFTYHVALKETGYAIEMRPSVEKEAQPHRLADGAHDRATAEYRALHPQQSAPPSIAVQRTTKLRCDEDTAPKTAASSLSSILKKALREGASDIFLSSGTAPYMRLNGEVIPLDTALTRDEQIVEMISAEKDEKALLKNGNVDFGVSLKLADNDESPEKTHRFRINVFRHAHGLGAAIRPIRSRIPTLETLNLPVELYKLCSLQSGLVLVTGPSGSGKSSTLAAFIEHINQTESRHIISIEDPIEFEHTNIKSLVHQRESGTHVKSFSAGLRAALRENPDVIMLGEMRDPSTISAALTASETGHLVFSTLHTGSAAAAIPRIIDVFPGRRQEHARLQIASSLRAVVAQQLIPAVHGQGRVPVIEKLIVTHGVANKIREGRAHQVQSDIQTGGDEGMITFERSLASLVREGKISRAVALAHATDRLALQKLLG